MIAEISPDPRPPTVSTTASTLFRSMVNMAPFPALPVPAVHFPQSDPPVSESFAASFISQPPSQPSSSRADFTDEDLRQALVPLVEEVFRDSSATALSGLEAHLEPMLRATIRRALAEYSPASRPFQGPGTFDRLIWHLQALFTSRTYEDVVFLKTHRFQVEEVFLLDASSLALISFASCDPARHASAKRVMPTVLRLAMQLRHDDGQIRDSFELPDLRNAVSCRGSFAILVATVRGQTNDLLLSDLEFSLHRIEDRFREQFLNHGSALLLTLQPYLEDCLLIQAPASAS